LPDLARSTSAIAGGVGAAVGILVLAGVIALIIYLRRSKKRKEEEHAGFEK